MEKQNFEEIPQTPLTGTDHADITSAEHIIRHAEDTFPNDPDRQIAEIRRDSYSLFQSAQQRIKETMQLTPEAEADSAKAEELLAAAITQATWEDPALKIISEKIEALTEAMLEQSKKATDAREKEAAIARLNKYLNNLTDQAATYRELSMEDAKLDEQIAKIRADIESLEK